MAESDPVLYTVDNRVALITVNDPDRRNALTDEMSARLRQAVERAEADPEVHAVVVTGAGKAFCAGADLAALSVVQHRASAEAQLLNEQLTAALASRIAIEQAKGVISERAGITVAEAFARLRSYARNRNLRLTDVARAAVDGTLDPLAWAVPPARRPPGRAGGRRPAPDPGS